MTLDLVKFFHFVIRFVFFTWILKAIQTLGGYDFSEKLMLWLYGNVYYMLQSFGNFDTNNFVFRLKSTRVKSNL